MKYKKGDWVVLGSGGNGWSGKHRGAICKIADIGPHLNGKLWTDYYDFYVEYDDEVFGINKDGLPDQITRGPGKNKGGGCSKSIERYARADEIPKHRRVDLLHILEF